MTCSLNSLTKIHLEEEPETRELCTIKPLRNKSILNLKEILLQQLTNGHEFYKRVILEGFTRLFTVSQVEQSDFVLEVILRSYSGSGFTNILMVDFFNQYARTSVTCKNQLFKILCLTLTFLSQCKDHGFEHPELGDGLTITREILGAFISNAPKDHKSGFSFMEPLPSYEQALVEYIALLLIDYPKTTPSIFRIIPDILSFITFREVKSLPNDKKRETKNKYHSLCRIFQSELSEYIQKDDQYKAKLEDFFTKCGDFFKHKVHDPDPDILNEDKQYIRENHSVEVAAYLHEAKDFFNSHQKILQEAPQSFTEGREEQKAEPIDDSSEVEIIETTPASKVTTRNSRKRSAKAASAMTPPTATRVNTRSRSKRVKHT